MRKTIITAIAAVIATGTIAGPAAASEVSVSVSVADLDLSTPEGAKTLDARVDGAVNTVCERPFIRDLKANVAWEDCKAEARSGALEQVSFDEQPFAGIALASNF